MRKRDFFDYIIAGATVVGGLVALHSLFNNNKQQITVIHHYYHLDCNLSMNTFRGNSQCPNYGEFDRITLA
jgi:hypothetical protein